MRFYINIKADQITFSELIRAMIYTMNKLDCSGYVIKDGEEIVIKMPNKK